MTQHPVVNRIRAGYQQIRSFYQCLSVSASPILDESLRLILLWVVLMLLTMGGLELCRFFWLIYPETVIGQVSLRNTAVSLIAAMTGLHQVVLDQVKRQIPQPNAHNLIGNRECGGINNHLVPRRSVNPTWPPTSAFAIMPTHHSRPL